MLPGGQAWQRRRYKYRYKYRPHVRIYQESGRWMAEFDCMDEPIEVVRVNLLDEGVITCEFNGFDSGTRFAFSSGRVWEQAEHKCNYKYAHRPQAMVIDSVNGILLHVDGMSDHVRVRRT